MPLNTGICGTIGLYFRTSEFSPETLLCFVRVSHFLFAKCDYFESERGTEYAKGRLCKQCKEKKIFFGKSRCHGRAVPMSCFYGVRQ